MANLESNPFDSVGLSPDVTDLITRVLKRGRGGQGAIIDVELPNDRQVRISQVERTQLVEAVDRAAGPNGPMQVAQVLGDIIERGNS